VCVVTNELKRARGKRFRGCHDCRAGANDENERSETLVTLLVGFPKNQSAQAIIGAISERALHAASSLMLKAFHPQPTTLTDIAKLLKRQVAQHGYAA
jgi:hypothetical protein